MPARPARLRATLAVALVAAALPAAIPAPVAAASVYKVTAVGDSADHNVGDGICDADARPDVTKCTLRAAIQEANHDPDPTTIRFRITVGASAVKTITPNSALPAITQPATIDGYTQAGSSVNTAATGTNAVIRIELDGRFVTDAGLTALAPVTIRGLAVYWFGRGIQISAGADGSQVIGNFIGVNAAGTEDRGNDTSGLLVNAQDVKVGTILRADRNLISGNTGAGVNLGITARRALVQNNLIGTGKNGRKDLANEGDGIFITGSRAHLIGGTFAAQGNVIGWNNGNGVTLVTVEVDGTPKVPGGVRILYNSIFRSGGLAIDLGDDGVTPNDAVPDPDTGPNGLMNFPKIDSARAEGGATVVTGRISTRRDIDVLIQLFASPAGDPEAKTPLASFTLATGTDGKATFTRSVAAQPAGTLITATATDGQRSDTSEVGPARAVVVP